MQAVPAIDLMDGKCVRLDQGDYTRRTDYSDDPADTARKFRDSGLRRLHLVDLDGARARKVRHWQVLEAICSATDLAVDFSGGISNSDDVERALDSGATQVAVGSLAVHERDTVASWISRFGPERIIIGADVRDGTVAVHGWQEASDRPLIPYMRDYVEAGARYFLCTEIERDGRLGGPATALYREVLSELPGIHLIASGGVSSLDDLRVLRQTGCGSAIVGKALYEGRFSAEDLAELEREVGNDTQDTGTVC